MHLAWKDDKGEICLRLRLCVCILKLQIKQQKVAATLDVGAQFRGREGEKKDNFRLHKNTALGAGKKYTQPIIGNSWLLKDEKEEKGWEVTNHVKHIQRLTNFVVFST